MNAARQGTKLSQPQHSFPLHGQGAIRYSGPDHTDQTSSTVVTQPDDIQEEACEWRYNNELVPSSTTTTQNQSSMPENI